MVVLISQCGWTVVGIETTVTSNSLGNINSSEVDHTGLKM